MILLIKRKPHLDFAGDKQWQVAPYKIESRDRGEKFVRWLKATVFGPMQIEYKIIDDDERGI